MAFSHGRHTIITVDADDLSAYTNTSEFTVESDEHDITHYGDDDYVVDGGLLSGGFTMGGTYDNGASGPKAVLEPLIGTVVAIVRKPEGTGTGLPQEAFNGLLKKYVETNPVAGMITWSAEFTKSGAVTRTTQS